MTGRLRAWFFWSLIGAPALGGHALHALTPAESQAREDRLGAELGGFVRDQVDAYFRGQQLSPPAAVTTRTRVRFASLDADAGADESVRVAEIDLAVAVVTDQPSPVVREARQTVARALVERGYRFETLAGVTDHRPLVTLTLQAIEPPPGTLRKNGTKEYLAFAAILLGLAASLLCLGLLLVRPLRRQRRPLAARFADPPVFVPRDTLPEIPLHPDTATDRPPPPLDPETAALRQLPFEQVLDLLLAADPAARRVMIAKLDLNPPLRLRLEQELL